MISEILKYSWNLYIVFYIIMFYFLFLNCIIVFIFVIKLGVHVFIITYCQLFKECIVFDNG